MGTTLTTEEIASLAFQQLREACEKANLSRGGDTEALRQRLQMWNTADSKKRPVIDSNIRNTNVSCNGINYGMNYDNDDKTSKRQKEFKPDDLICPITTELPWDPVTAEDGRVYERAAIERHIKSRHGYELRSPITNEIMGRRLLPALQHKNLIQSLIDSGILTGDLTNDWNEKLNEMKEKEALLKLANSGDSMAMHKLAHNYYAGWNGFEKDHILAFQWHQRAHNAGEIQATAWMGTMLLEGRGVNKSTKEGIMYVCLAAGQGSKLAAYVIGKTIADGKHGLKANTAEAIRWLKKSIRTTDPQIQSLSNEDYRKATEKLIQLESL